MPEIQPNDQQGKKISEHFIELIMMQTQEAMLFLGKLPHPSTGETVLNLKAAKMFIDYLEAIEEKTKGNLSADEEKILNNLLSELRLSYVQVSANAPEKENLSDSKKVSSSSILASPNKESIASEEETKKRFTKTYGE